MPRFAALLLAGSVTCLMAQPRYTGDGQLMLPSDYREWVFLSSGLGGPHHGHMGSGTMACCSEMKADEHMKPGGMMGPGQMMPGPMMGPGLAGSSPRSVASVRFL